MIEINPATSLNIFFDYGYKETVTEQLRRTHAAGFDYIDINFWDWGHSPESPFYGEDWRPWVGKIAEWGKATGVRFHQAHAMVFNPFDGKPESLRKAESARRAIIGAGMLGIDWVVFHPADIAGAGRDTLLRRNVEWLRPFAELAAENNTGIALENMNDYGKNIRYCYNAGELCDLTDALEMPNVGICWDTGHAHCQKLDQYSEIIKLGSRLKVLHVQDNDSTSDAHTAPFYGTIQWAALKKALDEISYKGEFTFEAHMLVRAVPDDCKDAAANLLYRIGSHICSMN